MLYKRIKKFKAGHITLDNPAVAEAFNDAQEIKDESFLLVINKVWEKLKGLSAVELMRMTHMRNTPWSIVYENEATRYAG